MRYDKERRFPGQDAMSKCLTISTSHSVLVTGSEIQTTSAPRVMMPVPGLIHERSDKCRLEDDQFPGKLMPPSNTLFVTPRDPYPSHSLASQPSSISSTNSLIVLTPDNYGHCTATLLGPTTSSGAKAHTFDKSAFASSIAYLRSQQDVCFSHVDDEHACSVAITFTLDTLGHIPMLRDAMRDCEQVTPKGETPHLAIEMAEGAPVTVWALVDLLACVISCHRQTYKGPNGQVADLCRQCVGGIRPQALADLLLVSYIMSCDAVYHAAAFAAATEAGNGLRLYGLLPGDAVTDAQGRQVPVIAIFNHWKVLNAIAAIRAPLFVEHIQRATLAHPGDRTSNHSVMAHLATQLCPRSLVRLELPPDISYDQWNRVVHLLHIMPLEHFTATLPLASARRERSIPFELKEAEVWRSGDVMQPAPCAEDIAGLAVAAVAGGLLRLKHLNILGSQLDAPCMAPLGQVLVSTAATLLSLNLHGSLRLYKLTEHGCADILVRDALRPLQRLQVLCVAGLMMPGMQKDGWPDGMQDLIPWGELPEMQVVVFDMPSSVGHSRARDGGVLGMRLGEDPVKYQDRLLGEVGGVRVAQTPPCCQRVLREGRQPTFLRLMR